MNPLTLVKRTQKINSTEAALGISEEASWHAKYKDSAYVFVGGIPFDLSEGDLLAVFAQYGEIVDVNLVRDKGTGKSKGFAFLAYEDQRSTILAVDNLNGAKILGRIVRVDHVANYKKKEEEDEEKEQQKREARGVCRAFQRGECNRGAACKFSHDEQRSANTGWGAKDSESRWNNDKYEGPPKNYKNSLHNTSDQTLQYKNKDIESKSKLTDRYGHSSRLEANNDHSGSHRKWKESSSKDHERRGSEKKSEKASDETESGEDRDLQTRKKHSRRHKLDDADQQESEKRSRNDRQSSTHRKDGDHQRR